MSISRSNIGEVLVSMGEITQEKLDIALQMQQKNGGSLADALVDSKACDGVHDPVIIILGRLGFLKIDDGVVERPVDQGVCHYIASQCFGQCGAKAAGVYV